MKSTPLHALHRSLQARLVEFAGFEMPVVYTDIIGEHHAVRRAAGVFDLSHMGRYRVSGPDADRLLGRAQTADIPALQTGRTRYALFLAEDGGIVDDILVSREEGGFLLVVNAGNRDADMAHLRAGAGGLDVTIRDDSDRLAMVAIQGPRSADLIATLGLGAGNALGYYRFGTCDSPFGPVLLSRTGYTGEDGFEILLEAGAAPALFTAALEAGRQDGVRPCGLGARDTLRLEAGMRLYSHEISRDVNPVEAGLDDVIRSRDEFQGVAALRRIRAAGPARRLLGLRVDGPHIPRQGCAVLAGGREIGRICSGTLSPTLGFNIATALVEAGAGAGADLTVAIRRHVAAAREVPLPFYKRPKTS